MLKSYYVLLADMRKVQNLPHWCFLGIENLRKLTSTDCLSIGKADDELENEKEEENESNKTIARIFTIFRSKYDKGFIRSKKITIIWILLGISFVGAIIVTFLNVNEVFNNLHTFYAGYMGRKLVLSERVEENKQCVRLDNDNQW